MVSNIWSMEWNWYYIAACVWAIIGVITFLYLFWQTAPYGRHKAAGWGPEIPNRLGWMLMEGLSPIFISIWFWVGNSEKSTLNLVLYALYLLHYVYRGWVFPFLTRTQGKTMPVSITFSAIFFNLINTFFIGYQLGFMGGRSEISTLEALLGGALFVLGFIIHFKSDQILINLRKPGETDYKLPQGFLYKYVASPNYLGELIEWTGYAILFGHMAGWLFVFWTFVNLFPRAVANQKWYKKHFPDYPLDRKVILPGIF